MNKKVIVGAVVGIAVLVAAGYFIQLQREAAKWQQVKEIDDERSFFHKEDNKTSMRFVSVVDAPIDQVQAALWAVEDSSKNIENIHKSELLEQQGNTKVVEMHVQALNLPLQYYTMEFKLDPDAHRITFKTRDSNMQDLEGSYQLEASPDGKRTEVIYEAKGTEKVAVPFPDSVIESANREVFVNTIRAIKKRGVPSAVG